MKKLLSVLLSVMLCMCVMMSAPWNRCFATENPDDPVPCVDEGMGDNFQKKKLLPKYFLASSVIIFTPR